MSMIEEIDDLTEEVEIYRDALEKISKYRCTCVSASIASDALKRCKGPEASELASTLQELYNLIQHREDLTTEKHRQRIADVLRRYDTYGVVEKIVEKTPISPL